MLNLKSRWWIIKKKLVELAGFEPASKQATYVLSTCLVYFWFSIESREQTPYSQLSSLSFGKSSELTFTYPYIPVPLDQTPYGWALERYLASLPCKDMLGLTVIQSIKQLKRNCCCQLKSWSAWFTWVHNVPRHAYIIHCPCCQNQSAP